MSKEELRILNQNHHRPKKRVVIPSTEYLEPKSDPIDDEKLISICINFHKATFNGKSPQEIHVKFFFKTCFSYSSKVLYRNYQRLIGNERMNLVKKVSCNVFNFVCKCLEMMNYLFKNVRIYLN